MWRIRFINYINFVIFNSIDQYYFSFEINIRLKNIINSTFFRFDNDDVFDIFFKRVCEKLSIIKKNCCRQFENFFSNNWLLTCYSINIEYFCHFSNDISWFQNFYVIYSHQYKKFFSNMIFRLRKTLIFCA